MSHEIRAADEASPTRPEADADAPRNETALVVFADNTDLKFLRAFRRGFRHCFVAVQTGRGWVICDPLSHQTHLSVVCGFSADELAAWYRSYGLRVIETRMRAAPSRPAPVRPYTCVEAVKRVLGLHAPWVVTPWQLYKHLLASRDYQPYACSGVFPRSRIAGTSLDKRGNDQ